MAFQICNNLREISLAFPLLGSFLIGAFIYLYYLNKNAHLFWIKRGIKGPKPWPFVGNFIELFFIDRMRHQKEWPQKYGKLYGCYLGWRPVLYVADAEILQQICVKDFDVFTNHEFPEFFNRYHKSFIFFQKDQQWKRLRALMTPTFTSAKIKRMFCMMDGCANDLLACFNEKLTTNGIGGEINVKEIYDLLTLDNILTCCYGLKLERSNGEQIEDQEKSRVRSRQDFVQLAQSLLEEEPWRLVLGVAGPKSLLKMVDFKMFKESHFDNFATAVGQLIERRRKQSDKQQFDDYLQLIINAKLDDKLELNEMDLNENHHANLTQESLLSDQEKLVGDVKNYYCGSQVAKQMLNEHEIITNAMLMLLVALETTASLLATCTYLLAFHQEIQERLHANVKKIAEFNDIGDIHFSYEALTSCHYLDCVLSEALRFLTPIFHLDRVASRDYRIEKYNLDIPKDCLVTTAFYAIMNDPDYWPEPEKFDPERFMPGNKEKIVPGSYCPFGLGPRHCLGMRFSLTETKLALAKTIMKFRFEPAAESKFPPLLSKRIDIVKIEKPTVLLIPRKPH